MPIKVPVQISKKKSVVKWSKDCLKIIQKIFLEKFIKVFLQEPVEKLLEEIEGNSKKKSKKQQAGVFKEVPEKSLYEIL